jgi:subtilase family serine protease
VRAGSGRLRSSLLGHALQQAAAEGISVFVSSGDSGASGCDAGLASPPLNPEANSPNYICSSSYATCVGGTEFNDTTNPSSYWNSKNGPGLGSALSYIPEGAWNEPLGENSTPQVAASGGGVSSLIPTPDWQTGTGVPSARAGRYTPDVAFSSSGHDGYFGCFAAGAGSCVVASDGSFEFEAFYGTSAATPSMAGIAALLDGRFGASLGNLNPALYQMAASYPASFHDVTVDTSGVSDCSVTTPSMCNNSVPSSNPVGSAQSGFLITAGYDEVTGLGSLDAANFIFNFTAAPTIDASLIPQLITFSVQLVGLTRTMEITVGNSGSSTLNPLSVSFTGAGAEDFSADNGCQISLAPGARCSFQLTFAPSEAGTITATMTISSTNAAYSPNISLVGGGTTQLFTPVIGWELPPSTPTTAQAIPITMVVGPPAFAPDKVTGSIVLQAGSFTSPATTISAVNTAEIDIPAGALAVGNNTLTATFTPDSASSAYFTSATGTTSLVVGPVAPPGFTLSGSAVSVAPGSITGNTSTITVTPTAVSRGASP